MIFEGIINLLCTLIVGALHGFNLVTLPVNLIQALGAFAAYGSYIVGSGFTACVLLLCAYVGIY